MQRQGGGGIKGISSFGCVKIVSILEPPNIFFKDISCCCCSHFCKGEGPCFVSSSRCPFWLCNLLAEKVRDDCFNLIVLYLSVSYVSSSLSRGLVCSM